MDEMPEEQRREVLRLLLDGVTIDGENNVNLTLAIPTEEFISIEKPILRFLILYSLVGPTGFEPVTNRL